MELPRSVLVPKRGAIPTRCGAVQRRFTRGGRTGYAAGEMNIASLTGVEKTVGNGLLFEEVTLGIEAGEKVGLVGRNGSGKSTLLRLISGEIPPDEGQITTSRGVRLSTLRQHPEPIAGLTVEEYLFPDLYADAPSPVQFELDAEEQAAALQRYRAACSRLGITELEQKLETLSGGMLKKVAIARCFAFEPDLMTLDEPTNHLDLDSITWLEQYLADCASAFVLVTHDRYILDATCTTILEIEGKRVHRHPGNYSAYLERRAEREHDRNVAEQRRTTILRRELEWLKRGPKARTGKDKKRKERIATMLADEPQREQRLQGLPAAQRRLGKKAVELEHLSKRYAGTPIIRDLSYRVAPGERIGIIGPNGSGKTTLLDLIAGRVRPDHGSVEHGETVALAYFDQTAARIDRSLTVLEYLTEVAERVPLSNEITVSAEQFLERFLFPRSMQSQLLERLSGGELRRLYLVRLLAGAPNVLLFDEPTNDLDIETLRILERYLDEFDGCILLVSHDRALLDRVTDSLWILDGAGGVKPFVGSYDEYLANDSAETGPATGPATGPTAGAGAGAERRPKKAVNREEKAGLSYREQREYERLPDEIAEDEAELQQLEEGFQQPAQDPEFLERQTKRYHELLAEVERKTARWEELAERAVD